jgi:hypothetical protein
MLSHGLYIIHQSQLSFHGFVLATKGFNQKKTPSAPVIPWANDLPCIQLHITTTVEHLIYAIPQNRKDIISKNKFAVFSFFLVCRHILALRP